MNSLPPTDMQLTAEAADWLVRLTDQEPEPADPDVDRVALQTAFYAWLVLSRRHLETTINPLERLSVSSVAETSRFYHRPKQK